MRLPIVILALYASNVASFALFSDTNSTDTNAPLHSFSKGLFIGAAINPTSMNDKDVNYILLNRKDYNMFVAENECKFPETEPSRDVFNFSGCDNILKFTHKVGNGAKFRGHNLIWADDNYNPSWLKDGGFSDYELFQSNTSILHKHIKVVAGRYRKKAYAWDVVNEALLYNDIAKQPFWRTGTWRKNATYDPTEITYVDYAFKHARAADKHAKLFYNDYGGEACGEGHSDGIYNFVKNLKNRGVPIDGVGLQMHIDINASSYINQNSVACNIKRLGKLGLEVHITELDVDCNMNGVCDERMQAYMYQQVLLACLQEKAYCKAFLTWGYTDKYTWHPGQSPLAENSNTGNNEKVAWHEMQAVLRYSGY